MKVRCQAIANGEIRERPCKNTASGFDGEAWLCNNHAVSKRRGKRLRLGPPQEVK